MVRGCDWEKGGCAGASYFGYGDFGDAEGGIGFEPLFDDALHITHGYHFPAQGPGLNGYPCFIRRRGSSSIAPNCCS